jgi:hypothetical protein
LLIKIGTPAEEYPGDSASQNANKALCTRMEMPANKKKFAALPNL